MFLRTLVIGVVLAFVGAGCRQDLPTDPLPPAGQQSDAQVLRARTRAVRAGWPVCANSAGLTKCSCESAGTLVLFREGVDMEAAARRLATKYGISDYSVHPFFGLYASGVGEMAVAQIRCDPEVALVKRFTYPSPSGDLVCAPCSALS